MLDKGFLIEHVDMTGDAAEADGMVCGGVMEVLIEAF
jgi:xanthine dehydrogenase accessory factor